MSNSFNDLYEFGEFRFDGGKLRLWQKDELISLSPKASELLKLLLERNGEFISKEEIFKIVWSDTFVEDGVLTQNIYTLRKALGNNPDGLPIIENKTRLGYRITTPIISNGKNYLQLENLIPEKSKTTATKRFSLPFIITVSLISVSILAFLGWCFLTAQNESISRSVIENMHFQRVTDTGDASFPALSPDGNFVAYSRRDDAIYVKDLRTNVESKLDITNVKKFGVLQFSKDSEFIYLKNSASFAQPASVLKVSRYGGEAKNVSDNVWSGFSLSPDERQMAFVRSFPTENRQTIIVKNIENGEERELFTLNSPQEFYLRTFPGWSANGKKLVFAVNKQNQGFSKFVIADLLSGKTEDLLVENFRDVSQVIWHPKRNTLLASAREGKNSQLWEIKYPGNQTQRLTNDLSSYLSPRISDDGTKLLITEGIVFSNIWVYDKENESLQKQLTFSRSNTDGIRGIAYFANGEIVYTSDEGKSSDTNLWRINPNNNERKQLTENTGSRNENPVVSPDEKYIYFSSNRGGKLNIWRIDPNGENPTQITSGDNTVNTFPQIAHDGSSLYFIRNSGKSAAVWRRSLADNKEEQLTTEKQYNPTNFLTMSPDGSYLAFQNLSEKVTTENPQQNFQIAIIETANPQKGKFFNLSGRQVGISWTADSKSFSYIMPKKDADEIWQQNIDENIAPILFRIIQKETIFGSAFSKDGRTFAISSGQLSYNPILITNFE